MVALAMPVFAQNSSSAGNGADVGSSAGNSGKTDDLRILSIIPVDGSSGNRSDTKVLITFDRELDKDSVHLFSFILEEGDGPRRVFGNLDYNPAMKAVRFTPAESLKNGMEYSFTVGRGVQGSDGSKLTSEKRSTFVVGRAVKSAASRSVSAAAAAPLNGAETAVKAEKTQESEKAHGEWLGALEKKLDAVRLEKREQVRKERAMELRRAAASTTDRNAATATSDAVSATDSDSDSDSASDSDIESDSDTRTSEAGPEDSGTDEKSAIASIRPSSSLRNSMKLHSLGKSAKDSGKKADESIKESISAVRVIDKGVSTVSSGVVSAASGKSRYSSDRLKVADHFPGSNARDISGDAVILVTFSADPGKLADWEGRVSIRRVSDGKSVALTLEMEGRSLKVRPRLILKGDTLYQVTVSGNPSSSVGPVLDRTYGWLFRTSSIQPPADRKAPPRIVLSEESIFGEKPSVAESSVAEAAIVKRDSAITDAVELASTVKPVTDGSSLAQRLRGRLRTIRQLVSGSTENSVSAAEKSFSAAEKSASDTASGIMVSAASDAVTSTASTVVASTAAAAATKVSAASAASSLTGASSSAASSMAASTASAVSRVIARAEKRSRDASDIASDKAGSKDVIDSVLDGKVAADAAEDSSIRVISKIGGSALANAGEKVLSGLQKALTLVSHIPGNGEERVTRVTPIVLSFDRSVDPATVGPQAIKVTREGSEGWLRGRFYTMKDKVYFKADKPGFQSGAHYFCQVTEALKGRDGSSLSGDYLWDFTIDNGVEPPDTAASVMASTGAVSLEPAGSLPALSGSVSDNGDVKPGELIDRVSQDALLMEYSQQSSARIPATVADTAAIAVAGAAAGSGGVIGNVSGSGSISAHSAVSSSASSQDFSRWGGWLRFVIPADGMSDVLPNARIQIGVPADVEPSSVNIFNIVLRKGDSSGIPSSQMADDTGKILGNIYIEMDTHCAWFSPLNPLEYGSWYILTVKGLKRSNGAEMKEQASFTFRTMDKIDSVLPRVVSTEPVRGADDVAPDANVNVCFSEPLDKDSVNMFCLTVNDGSRNLFGSVVLSEKTHTVTFIPRENLAHDTIYRVSMAGVRDLAGNSMEPVQWLFRTSRRPDSDGPRVVEVRPGMGEDGVSSFSAVVATLSEPIDEVTVTHNSVGLWNGTTYVDGKVMYDREKSTLSFFPSVKLQDATLYNAFVSRGIRDMAGNAMGSHFTWTFVTEKPKDRSNPVISEILPTIGSRSVSVLSAVRVKFSESINRSTLSWKNLGLREEDTGRDIPGDYTYDESTWIASFVPSERLAYATAYRAWVGTGIKDMADNPLAAGADWAFVTEEKPDTQAPRVLSVSPIVGARNVAVNSDVTVSVSEALKAQSITPYSLTLMETSGKYPVSGEVTLDPLTNTLALKPAEALKFDTVYTVSLADSVEDQAGNRMGKVFSWNFRTVTRDFAMKLREFDDNSRDGALAVAESLPADGVDGVDPATDMTVRFNRSVAPSTVNEDTIFVIDDMGRSVKAMMSYDDVRNTVIIRPVHDLNRNTLYTLIVTGGAVFDTFGVPMRDDFTATFRTLKPGQEPDRGNGAMKIDPVRVAAVSRAAAGARGEKDETAPMVTETSPRNGSFDVIETPSITVTFNEEMDPLTVNEYTMTLDDGDKYIPGTVAFHQPTGKALFSPKVKLARGATYRVTITGDVKDRAGNGLASPKVFSFTVIHPKGPRVVKISPPNGSSETTVTSDVRVAFDKQVLALTLTSFNFQVLQGVKPVKGRISYDTFTRQAIFIPDMPMEYGKDYQVRLLPGIQDTSGNDMEEYSWSFRTIGNPMAGSGQGVMDEKVKADK
jgi:hypothetical protein